MMLKQLLRTPTRSIAVQRNFSSLLVPLAPKQAELAELKSTPLTDKYFADLQVEYAKFNDQCAAELVEMNQNVISNIVARGGDAGWEQAANFDCLTKKFEFTSFEQADAFVQAVGLRANAIDHHPEWHVSNGGCTVNVRLTSHFAGNKVTRLDFELAEICNEEFTKNVSTYNMFPRFSNKEWVSIKFAVFAFCFGVFSFRIATGPKYPTRPQAYVIPGNLGEFKIQTGNESYILNDRQVESLTEKNLQELAIRHVVDRPILL